MVAKIENAPPGQAEGRSEQQLAMPFSNLTDLTTWKPTPEPTPAMTCGLCGGLEDLHFVSAGALCLGCFGCAVSVAASDLWPGSVRYDKTFETAVLM